MNELTGWLLDIYAGETGLTVWLLDDEGTRHCLSQTFSNLRPRFLQHGVKKKSDAMVSRCVFYLLEELAIKVGAFETGEFTGELLPHGEMDVTNAIYSGAYFECPVSRKGFNVFSMTPDGISQVHYSHPGADSG